jgi:hypothetical protein
MKMTILPEILIPQHFEGKFIPNFKSISNDFLQKVKIEKTFHLTSSTTC